MGIVCILHLKSRSCAFASRDPDGTPMAAATLQRAHHVCCSGMHGRQQAGLGICAQAGEAAHKDADDWLRGHHGQKGAPGMLRSHVHRTASCCAACMRLRNACAHLPIIRHEQAGTRPLLS